MAYYSRMDVMRMSDEEIKRILEEEGSSLDEGVAALMLDELKKRSEQPEEPDLGLSEEELAEINASADEEDGEEGEEKPEETSDEESEEEELSKEERLEQLEKEIEAENKESKRTLVIACAAAGIVAVATIAVILIMKATGKL